MCIYVWELCFGLCKVIHMFALFVQHSLDHVNVSVTFKLSIALLWQNQYALKRWYNTISTATKQVNDPVSFYHF